MSYNWIRLALTYFLISNVHAAGERETWLCSKENNVKEGNDLLTDVVTALNVCLTWDRHSRTQIRLSQKPTTGISHNLATCVTICHLQTNLCSW